MQKQTQTVVDSGIPQENILVVSTKELFFEGAWQGLRGADEIDMQKYLDVIQSKKEFLPRPAMENDQSYKQIIPYLVFEYQGKLFLMQRQSTASESRLRSKLSLGIGGHIREDDMTTDSIFDWAKREFAEEVSYKGGLKVEMVGILNDDSNDVGKVHVGLVMKLVGDSDDIKVESELKSGELLSFDDCEKVKESMESWSKIAFEYLQRSSK